MPCQQPIRKFVLFTLLAGMVGPTLAAQGTEARKKHGGASTQAPSGESATFDMGQLLANTTEAGKASDILYKGKHGAWIFARGTSSPPTCAVIYVDRRNGTSLAYRGPRPEVGDKGSLVFIGPAIPATSMPLEVRVTLETDGERPQTIPAGHLPRQGEIPAAILVSTDIRATIAVIQPAEIVKLSLRNQPIYHLEWDGGGREAGHALTNCLNGS